VGQKIMIQNLYCNGDSHIAGTFTEWTDYGRSFAGVLAERHNLKYFNHGYPGGSNPRIIRTSKEHLQNIDPKSTVVLIAWSDSARAEWFVKDKWYQVANHRDYELLDDPYINMVWKKYFDSLWKKECDYVMLNRAIEQQYSILEFSHWLKDRGFKHLFLHANKSFFHKKSVFEINWPTNVWLNNDAYDETQSFCSQSLIKGHKMDSHAHFDHYAHKDYADFIESNFVRLL
jgi:hypothetical protein